MNPTAMTDPRPNLFDLTVTELSTLAQSLGEKPWRGRSLAIWLFKRGVTDWNLMTDMARSFHLKLAEAARLELPTVLNSTEGDGAQKILWRLTDGLKVESVLIRERGHQTLCLSSQVGCALSCRFCRTGTMGFTRNLSPSEILGQIIGAQRFLTPNENITNLVFMGMGEPLLNLAHVVHSLNVIVDPNLMAISRRRLSLSTVGIVPELYELARTRSDLGLTVSLSAPDDRLRSQIMPVNQRYPLAELKKALAAWPLSHGRRITIAYVLLRGINDEPAQATSLSRFLTGLKVKINLIPFNSWPGAPFEPSDPERVAAFQKILIQKHYTTIIRWSKGGQISAACGQLATLNKETTVF